MLYWVYYLLYKSMFTLTGKVAVITGGRRGMGRSHALALAKQGATVVVTDIDKQSCDSVVDEVISTGGKASCYKLDVANVSEINEVFDAIISEHGRVDILINNAGIYTAVPALEMTEDQWNTMININLRGQFFCAQRAAKEMIKTGWGRIINIGSIASGGVGVGIANSSHYTATKGGIIGMTESLAVEFAPHNITVNVVAPGVIDTPMVDGAASTFLSGVPLKRMGKSEEVSAAVVFLSSEEASYITGSTMYVDGGWLAS